VPGNALAQHLGVRAASVTGMLQKLAAQKPPFVKYEKHHGVRLTAAGKMRALEVIRHHRLLERFLHDFLDYSWDEVHDEAERLEHFISERLEDRLVKRCCYRNGLVASPPSLAACRTAIRLPCAR